MLLLLLLLLLRLPLRPDAHGLSLLQRLLDVLGHLCAAGAASFTSGAWRISGLLMRAQTLYWPYTWKADTTGRPVQHVHAGTA